MAGKEDFSSDRTSAKVSDAVVCMTNQDKRVDCYIIYTSLKRNTLIWLSLPLAQVDYDTGGNDVHPLRWEHDP